MTLLVLRRASDVTGGDRGSREVLFCRITTGMRTRWNRGITCSDADASELHFLQVSSDGPAPAPDFLSGHARDRCTAMFWNLLSGFTRNWEVRFAFECTHAKIAACILPVVAFVAAWRFWVFDNRYTAVM